MYANGKQYTFYTYVFEDCEIYLQLVDNLKIS